MIQEAAMLPIPDQGHRVWPSSTWPWRQGQSLVPPVRDNTAHTVAWSTTASPSKGPPPGTVAAHTDLSTTSIIWVFNGTKHAIHISQTLAQLEWHCETFQLDIEFHIVLTICMIRSSHLHICTLITVSFETCLRSRYVAWTISELADYMMNIAVSVMSYLRCFSGWESPWHTICLLHSV